MDDEFQQLEAELKSLRPARPSPQLRARIEADLGPESRGGAREPVRRSRRAWWIWAGAFPALAALAVLLVVVARRSPTSADSGPGGLIATATMPPAPPPAELFKPVSAENVLYSVSDEGLVTLDDGTAARRERLNYVDTITWKNPRTNASVRWTLPREEVRVVPVKFQ